MAEHIPPGQPILRGHHSEKRDRRYRGRIFAKQGKAYAEGKRAAYWTGRAEAAASYTAGRDNIPTTLRRIQKLEAEQRSVARELDRATPGSVYHDNLTMRAEQVAEELDHWRAHVAEAEASGVKIWRKNDFVRGDFARAHGRWYEVLRVNPKSVTTPPIISDGFVVTREGNRFGEWTNTVPYDKITGRRSAAEMAAVFAAAAADSDNKDGAAPGS